MEDTATAIFDCMGDDSSELTFNKGDVIENIQPAADHGWFQGTLQKTKKTGLFPGNYVTFNKKPSKKLTAAEARANLMQKSSTLAQKTRTAAAPVSTPPIADNTQKQSNSKPANVSSPEKSQESQKVVSQLARTFSETALKSNESLLESENSSVPRVGKRPPLLLSNQAYAVITDTSPTGREDSSPPKAPPPRPFKPVSLRSGLSATSLEPPILKENSVKRNDIQNNSQPSDSHTVNVLDSVSLQRYRLEFQAHDTDKDGFLQGDQVRGLWMKSGLEPRFLGLIWNLCDPANTGRLDAKGYVAGMILIEQKLKGGAIPPNLTKEFLDKCG